MAEHYICSKCEDLCEKIETYSDQKLEFWGAPVTKRDYEWSSDCCLEDCYTPAEWRENGWGLPKALSVVDLKEHGFLAEDEEY